MSKPVFINGKTSLDYCYQCSESRAAIKYSQSSGDPIYCVLMGSSTESGSAEAYQEYDRHRFVISEKAYNADIEAERRWFESHGVLSDWTPPWPQEAGEAAEGDKANE